jgi:hypothetical protein
MIKKLITMLILTLAISGCATVDKYLGSTKASYSLGNLNWESNKNQENLKAKFTQSPDGTTNFEIETTATTPESAMAAVAMVNLEYMKLVSSLVDKLMAGVKTGALAGS